VSIFIIIIFESALVTCSSRDYRFATS